MQTVRVIAKIENGEAVVCTEEGYPTASPGYKVGVKAAIEIDLRQTISDPETRILLPYPYEELADATAFYIAMDADWLQETQVKLYSSANISVVKTGDGRTVLRGELPSTANQAILDYVAAAKEASIHFEFAGITASGSETEALFAWTFNLMLRNRVYLGGTVPPEVVNDPEYLTAAQVRALIAEALRPPKGDKGDPGQSAYQIAVAGGYKGSVAEWLASLKGDPGKSAYEIAVEGGYTGTRDEWLASLKGDAGANAYEIAVSEGYTGTVAQWLDDLRGAPGRDLHFDATGPVSELDVYRNEAAGFTFGASAIDAAAKNTKLYVYVKKSAALNDWFPPLEIVYYGADACALLEPLEFKGPASDYLYFDMTARKAAHIAAVCIDTADGEYVLPYNSALGISKIIKEKSGKMKIYFGTNCPEFETGRVYFSQGFAGRGESTEPPADVGAMYYGYIPTAAAGGVYTVSEITKAMITAAGAAMKSGPAATLGKTSIGTVPEGALVAVLIPAAANLTATKFDGISGKAAFALNNGVTGTGANGTDVTLDGVAYKVFGEFKLNNAEVFIYVD